MTGVFLARALLSLGCGALLSAAFPPIGFWPLAVALAPALLLSANAPRAKGAFWVGFFFGVGFFTLHLFWLPQSFAPYSGGFFWLLYPPLVAVLGLFWGLVTFSGRWLGGRGTGALWLLPALWVLMEWARTQGVFAFPWGALGYLWVETPMVQLADLAGVYGISLLTLAVLALAVSPLAYRPAHAPRSWGRTFVALLSALLLVGGGLGYGGYRLRTVEVPADQRALLVQGSTNPYERATGAEVEEEITLYKTLTREAISALEELPELVVWPEGVVLDYSLEQGVGREAELQESAAGVPLITGAGAYDFEAQRSYNSAYSLAEGTVLSRYDKAYLVPFGEYFPFTQVLRPVYRLVFSWFGLEFYQSRSPGQAFTPLTLPSASAAVYICYESVFPQVPRAMVARGAEVLVNISNDAWFGSGGGAEQHFAMGTVRAVETRRYLLRAGNDGITALVDPLGRVQERLPRGDRGALAVTYGEATSITPYVRFGDLLVLALAGYAVGVSALWQVRARAQSTSPFT